MSSYREAGVSLTAAERMVGRLGSLAAVAGRPEVLSGVGGFAGLFALGARYRDPVLVAGADGVGSKLQLVLQAAEPGRLPAALAGLGVDCVAMNVNDVLTVGAEPLFFLDYLGVHALDPTQVEALVAGVASGCREAGCALLGGETAQLPDLYRAGDFDLAGFCVGVAERDRLLTGAEVRPGDAVVGLASAGVHSNGFALVRRILARAGGRGPIAELLTPTRIYVRPVLAALAGGAPVKALAHITGGGLPGNLPRSLPAGCRAVLHPGAWTEPAVFDWIRRCGGVAEDEMRSVFNLGVGLCAVVPAADVDAVCRALAPLPAWTIGEIVAGEPGVDFA